MKRVYSKMNMLERFFGREVRTNKVSWNKKVILYKHCYRFNILSIVCGQCKSREELFILYKIHLWLSIVSGFFGGGGQNNYLETRTIEYRAIRENKRYKKWHINSKNNLFNQHMKILEDLAS